LIPKNVYHQRRGTNVGFHQAKRSQQKRKNHTHQIQHLRLRRRRQRPQVENVKTRIQTKRQLRSMIPVRHVRLMLNARGRKASKSDGYSATIARTGSTTSAFWGVKKLLMMNFSIVVVKQRRKQRSDERCYLPSIVGRDLFRRIW
ncbi:hypothetical protein TELCIR_23728, partial [Teladorsagia circumcincta]